jgi:hypothetical protein
LLTPRLLKHPWRVRRQGGSAWGLPWGLGPPGQGSLRGCAASITSQRPQEGGREGYRVGFPRVSFNRPVLQHGVLQHGVPQTSWLKQQTFASGGWKFKIKATGNSCQERMSFCFTGAASHCVLQGDIALPGLFYKGTNSIPTHDLITFQRRPVLTLFWGTRRSSAPHI